ncbi:ParB N-terminal domain-containing protein [Limosilactobacillus mucosae]
MEQIQEVPISDVKPYANNPRDNDRAVEALAKSIKSFGWQQPIVVDKNMVVIVGHTRLKAAKKLGVEKVPVVIAENLTDEQAKAYRLADNKTGENAVWDNKKLLEELSSFDTKDLFTGFKTSEIFEDVLDEQDNSPIENNEKGITYSVSLKTQNKELYEQVKHFIEGVKTLDQ